MNINRFEYLCMPVRRIKRRSVPLYPYLFVRVLIMSYCVVCVCLRIVMSNILSYVLRASYNRQIQLTLPEQLGSPPVFGGFHVVNLFGFLCFVFCFICLRPVFFVPNLARFSGLSILEFPFSFL
jgi:hypothetical protein